MVTIRTQASRRPLASMTGPAVRTALDTHRRARFEAEFRAALVEVTHSFDTDGLAEVVRRWWLTAGGSRQAVEQDLADAARAATLSSRTSQPPRPAYLPAQVIDQTGPAVRAALPEPARIEFETQFEQALVAAAASFDHRGAQQVVLRWWAVALRHANPDDSARDREAARQVETGELTSFVYH